jgi:hypothetical protein
MYKQRNVLKHFRFECAFFVARSVTSCVCRACSFYPSIHFLFNDRKAKSHPCILKEDTKADGTKSHTEVRIKPNFALGGVDTPSFSPIFVRSE